MRLADGNPMTRTLSLTLIFEAIVFVLAIAGMIQVSGVPVGLALGAGLGAAVSAGRPLQAVQAHEIGRAHV